MFLLVRRCAEHMTQLPRLKVTGQGQRIYPLNSCQLHTSRTLWLIFMILHLYVPLCKRVCRAHYPDFRVCSISPEPFDLFSYYFTHMYLLVRRCAEHIIELPRLKVTGQGQWIYPQISCLLHIPWTLWSIFMKLH